MTVKELLEETPQDKEIDIRFFWIPSKRYFKDEDGKWAYRDGSTLVYDVNIADDDNPNEPKEDEEYGYLGTPTGFDSFIEDYGDWILDEDVIDEGDGHYRIEKFSLD